MFNITGLKALLPVQITVRALCTRLATPVIRIAIIELPFIQTIRDIIFLTYTYKHTHTPIHRSPIHGHNSGSLQFTLYGRMKKYKVRWLRKMGEVGLCAIRHGLIKT